MSMIIWDGRTHKVYDEPEERIMHIDEIEVIEPCESFRKNYNIELSDTTKLYRYMSYCKLEKLLKEQHVYLANANKLTDRHEREIPSSYFEKWEEKRAENLAALTKTLQKYTLAYLSCWTTKKDDYALWKIYDNNKDGCMIETTFGKLKAVFPKETVFYKVKYVGREGDKKYPLHIVHLPKNNIPSIKGCEEFKRFPYEYESEVRAVLYARNNCRGVLLDVTPTDFITGVMYNPLSSEKAQRRVEKLIHDSLPELEIESSVIDEKE